MKKCFSRLNGWEHHFSILKMSDMNNHATYRWARWRSKIIFSFEIELFCKLITTSVLAFYISFYLDCIFTILYLCVHGASFFKSDPRVYQKHLHGDVMIKIILMLIDYDTYCLIFSYPKPLSNIHLLESIKSSSKLSPFFIADAFNNLLIRVKYGL